MGFLDSFFVELNQFKRIANLEDKSRYVDNNSESVYKHEMLLIELENKIEQMALLFRTLYDLGINKKFFTKEEFRNMFDKIDLEDGIKDGKITRKKQ
jgi:hypothetical protein